MPWLSRSESTVGRLKAVFKKIEDSVRRVRRMSFFRRTTKRTIYFLFPPFSYPPHLILSFTRPFGSLPSLFVPCPLSSAIILKRRLYLCDGRHPTFALTAMEPDPCTHANGHRLLPHHHPTITIDLHPLRPGISYPYPQLADSIGNNNKFLSVQLELESDTDNDLTH